MESISSRNKVAGANHNTVGRRLVPEQVAHQFDFFRADASAHIDHYQRIRWLGLPHVNEKAANKIEVSNQHSEHKKLATIKELT